MGYLAPRIIILSDGAPTDKWENQLEELKKNNWFKSATKVTFAVVDDAAQNIQAKICCTGEAVVSISEPKKIRQYIKFVTATVTITGTTSSTGKSAQQIVNGALQSIDGDTPIVVDIPDINDSQW